jgi:hypothetical protein
LIRCHCDECEKLDRKRYQGIAGTFQARLELGRGACQARIAAPAPAPVAPSADDLPLFIGSLEPSLF